MHEQVFTPIRGWEILSPTFSGGAPGEDERPENPRTGMLAVAIYWRRGTGR
jgi:hypothetical protein